MAGVQPDRCYTLGMMISALPPPATGSQVTAGTQTMLSTPRVEVLTWIGPEPTQILPRVEVLSNVWTVKAVVHLAPGWVSVIASREVG